MRKCVSIVISLKGNMDKYTKLQSLFFNIHFHSRPSVFTKSYVFRPEKKSQGYVSSYPIYRIIITAIMTTNSDPVDFAPIIPAPPAGTTAMGDVVAGGVTGIEFPPTGAVPAGKETG
jgi:hypothetical protein